MGVKKFRDVSEMKDVWFKPGSPELFAAWRHTWALSDQICPLSFPPGVYKHRSIEDAERLRRQWERANFVAHRERMAAKKPGS
ncbi:MAG TPA: hypothetical protein VIV11_25305 [Kofleriaceae bacterium]